MAWRRVMMLAMLCLATTNCSGVNAARCPPSAQSANASPRTCTGAVADKHARLEVPGGVILVDWDPSEFKLPRDVIWKWIEDAARAVSAYYGRFPVAQSDLYIRASYGRGVGFGQASSKYKVPRVSVDLGRATRAEDLAHDWTLTHEMVHLAFPRVPWTHHWIEEGLATYIEPIARFKVGLRSEKSVWYEWFVSMYQGQPEEGDRGLDFTHTWGRVYWGGALFSLVADVEIRRRSNNRQGLRHALQGIVDAGGNMAVSWSITNALAIADRAIDSHVLSVEYQKRRSAPEPVDLDKLWQNLGVRVEHGQVVLDDTAPWADTRRAILRD